MENTRKQAPKLSIRISRRKDTLWWAAEEDGVMRNDPCFPRFFQFDPVPDVRRIFGRVEENMNVEDENEGRLSERLMTNRFNSKKVICWF